MPKHHRNSTTRAEPGRQAERWSLDAGDAGLATLLVPADSHRERRFEISCAMTVRRVADTGDAWHQLTVMADGLRQWQRRVQTHAGSDGLDYRFERSVPPGKALRIGAEVTAEGAIPSSLSIEADEVRD